MKAVSVALICAILLVVQQTASAINCYQCSVGTDGCGASSFSKTGAGVLSSSDSSATYCTKTVYSSNSNAAGRNYGTSGSCSSSTTSGTTSGIAYTQHCCSTDLCNGAGMTGVNFLLAIGAAVIGLYFVK